jgi:hypothetical protein
MKPITDGLRRAGAGRMAYRCWHRPRQLCDLARTYGWRLVAGALANEPFMRRAARRLPPPEPVSGTRAPAYFLTGQRFWHQTAFCAHSLRRNGGEGTPLIFTSDGSLDGACASALLAIFPDARILSDRDAEGRIAAVLPPTRYPVLHAHRGRFVLLRKLLDTLTDMEGYGLVLDSDMLFWRRPDSLLARAEREQPFYLSDIGEEGYTLPLRELKSALGVEAAAGVNSGLVAAHAGKVDWDLMERACRLLVGSAGDQRLLEQTLWAIALGGQDAKRLCEADYRVVIDPDGWRAAMEENPVLIHYAWHARLPFVAGEWRRYLRTVLR